MSTIDINDFVSKLTLSELRSIRNIGQYVKGEFDNVNTIILSSKQSISKKWLTTESYMCWMTGPLERRIFIEGLKDMYPNFNNWDFVEKNVEIEACFPDAIEVKNEKPINMLLSNKATNNFYISDYPVDKTKTVFAYYDTTTVAGFNEEDVMNYCKRLTFERFGHEDCYERYDEVIDSLISKCKDLVELYKKGETPIDDTFNRAPMIMFTFANFEQVKECVEKLKTLLPLDVDFTTPEWLFKPTDIKMQSVKEYILNH